MATCNNSTNITIDSPNRESPTGETRHHFTLDALPFGRFRITDNTGASEDCTLDELIIQLKHIRAQARDMFADVEFDMLLKVARWHFPKSQYRFSGRDVVYFATFSHTPDQIKIGFTGALRSRITHLAWQNGEKFDATVQAYAEHMNVRAFEEALHKKFAADRITGEWFEAAPVLAWLDTVKNGGAK